MMTELIILGLKDYTEYTGKISPSTGSRCPEDSRKLRFPDYMTVAQDGGKVVSRIHQLLFTPRKYSWYLYLLQASSNKWQGGRLIIMQKLNVCRYIPENCRLWRGVVLY